MLSSTSSSNQRLPRLEWRPLLLSGLLIFILGVGALEAALAWRGYRPNLSDSASLWAKQRIRVDELGSKALVLVGGSRMLLDTDLGTLRRHTGYEPVQLAVDGSSFVPVLADLAADPEVKGTVLVDFDINILAAPVQYDDAYAYVDDYEFTRGRRLADFHSSEQYFADFLHAHLRSYADGARPLTSLSARVLKADPVRQYLFRLPDREVFADYSRAPLPALYYSRVMRNLGEDLTGRPGIVTYGQLDAALAERIQTLTPVDNKLFLQASRQAVEMARQIQSHGGRVLFADFPESGYVRAIDDHRFPRPLFWDQFALQAAAPTLHYQDVPAMTALLCPDGSHLDYHDRVRFTEALIGALQLGRIH